MMRLRTGLFLLLLLVVIVVVGVVILSSALDPRNTPQYAAAIDFVDAIGTGDDPAAIQILSPTLQSWVALNCPGGLVSACIDQFYIPNEWGDFSSVVFRRSQPDGGAWHIDLIATYERGDGFSGVCIYTHVSGQPNGTYLVDEWAGWIPCSDGRSREMDSNPETPNRAP